MEEINYIVKSNNEYVIRFCYYDQRFADFIYKPYLYDKSGKIESRLEPILKNEINGFLKKMGVMLELV